eukprot:c24766_g4_i1 orf=2-289(-)
MASLCVVTMESLVRTNSCKAQQEREEVKEVPMVCNASLDISHDHFATLLASLKACAKLKDLYTGSRIHVEIAERGLLAKNAVVGNTLVNMYAKCGA